ncbi:MAG: IS1595 family transposase [Alphaproteobacteria bacterium]|nr:IS1595 family transposase [Alphaproteobacteria bacterium]
MKNRYKKVAHFSEAKFRRVLKCFALDLTASDTAIISGLSRNTINKIFVQIRQRLLALAHPQSKEPKIFGVFECDESYFGARRVRGKRGRGAAGKTPVFGLLKRNENVTVTIVENCSRAELMPIIQGQVLEGSTINTDGWKAYDGLVVNGYDHYRVFHSENEFARGKCHVNGIESFWSFTKRRMAKFNGLTDQMFYLHLKESEWRFNYRNDNLYLLLLREFRKNPL